MIFKQWAAWLGAWVLFAWTYGAVCTAFHVPPWATVILPAFLGTGIYVSRTPALATVHLVTGSGTVMTCQTAVDTDGKTPQQVRGTLAAELATVEDKHPGWHCWLSSELHSYATRAYRHRCAVTLDAASRHCWTS
jgi:hypothetical protein